MNTSNTIEHKFLNSDFFLPTWDTETLVLGTFNPSCGEETDYFYGRKRNRFWRALEALTLNEKYYFDNNLSRKEKVMKNYKFGCTDIIKSIKINENYRNRVCGNGYSDSALFTLREVIATYQFGEIKKYLLSNKIKKVINTWGMRNKPNIFKNQVNDLEFFCNEHEIIFIRNCPSPSPRARNKFNILLNFYREHILNES
jgi:hypothetical protein